MGTHTGVPPPSRLCSSCTEELLLPLLTIAPFSVLAPLHDQRPRSAPNFVRALTIFVDGCRFIKKSQPKTLGM